MNQKEYVLAVLASETKASFSPVQLQKLFFVLDREISKDIQGPFFDFQPYDYGPFDKAVYRVVDQLCSEGLIEKIGEPGKSWFYYRLTPAGSDKGSELLAGYDGPVRKYISNVTKFVRNLNFAQLVSSIYKAYPDMKVNSVFRGS